MLISDEAWNRLLVSAVTFGMERGGVAILVAARLGGVLFIGPMLGRAVLTWPVRIGMVVLLTAIVTPQLPSGDNATAAVEFVAYSNSGVGIPVALDGSWRIDQVLMPSANLLMAVLREWGIGAAMGLGAAVFLSGLRLAGEWFDRHSGLEMGSVLNPESSTGGSGPAEFVSLFCVASILVLQPINGHLLVVRLILDSFHALPVGETHFPESIFELPKTIVQQSLILGLRIAMPFVVAMSLLDMTFGYANRSSRWQLNPVAYAVRGGASLLILAATFPGIQEAAALTLREAMQSASEVLVP